MLGVMVLRAAAVPIGQVIANFYGNTQQFCALTEQEIVILNASSM